MGRKSQSCLFCLKIGTQGILEQLILHPELLFKNSEPRTRSSVNLDGKSQSCSFCMKTGTEGILEELIVHPDLVFQSSEPQNAFLGKYGSKKSKYFVLP